MDSKICFQMSLFVVEAILGRCASFMILTATVSEICGGQTNVTIFKIRNEYISRNNGSGAGFQKDHGKTLELVWDEERQRIHTEENTEDRFIWE